MVRAMIHSSLAVMMRPSAATFEAHERNAFGWALLYVTFGATLTALLGWVSFVIQRPFRTVEYALLAAELATLEAQTGRKLPVELLFTPTSPAISVVANLLGTLSGFLIYVALVFVLGWVLGGRSTIGQLAYDIALFWVPISVGSAVLNVFSISVLACLTAPVALMITVYGLYLTYLSVQAGMNLAPQRARLLMFIPAVLWLLTICSLLGLVVGLAGQASSSAYSLILS